MNVVSVAPGLVLDGEMFAVAREALRQYAPDQVMGFTWGRFIARKSWVLVPNMGHPDEPFYKADFVIVQNASYPNPRTLKLVLWRSPDLRGGNRPMPYNHPWAHVDHVLMGGYRENRYLVDCNNRILVDPFSRWAVDKLVVLQRGASHRAGSHNVVPLTVFREVTEISDPGRTLTLMDCDLGRPNGWGHVEEDVNRTRAYVPTGQGRLDSRFRELLLERNPHLQE